MTHYIFVIGGVISGLGKGVTSASVASILQTGGKKILIKKIDPYFNLSAGNLNPIEHGEVFVTEDGTEADLDLGHYERIGDIKTSCKNTSTFGSLMQEFLQNQGNASGETIQLIPHFTNFIMNHFEDEEYDYVIIEIGGSVSDIESQIFFESARQFRRTHTTTILFMTYLLYYPATKEIKTKPTQNAVKKLREMGLQPDFLLCRTENPISEKVFNKLLLFTDVERDHIIEIPTAPTIYHVPLILDNQNLGRKIDSGYSIGWDRLRWKKLVYQIENTENTIRIGIVGKYTELSDAYYSIYEAVKHAGWSLNTSIKFIAIDARNSNNTHDIDGCDGIIVPGGFGHSGVENIIDIIRYCRIKYKPTLGICFGLQLMFIEYCRNVLRKPVYTQEITHNPLEVIRFVHSDGSMNLGKGSAERYRHRYAIPKDIWDYDSEMTPVYENSFVDQIKWNVDFFYKGVQHHPEFTSKPQNPSPLFLDFIKNIL